MVQFNLLPAVKIEYIKAMRTKRTVTSIAIIASLTALTILALLFINVNVVQKRHIANLTNDINAKVGELEAIPDIDKVLTVQNQLSVLTQLHEQKPATERVLPLLAKVTPRDARITETTFSYEENTANINGTADSLATVNKFVDTLKFTKFTTGSTSNEQLAFSEVVLSSFSVSSQEATFKIDFKFNPTIFDNTQQVELKVPNIISTRSQTERPSDLFQLPQTNPSEQ